MFQVQRVMVDCLDYPDRRENQVALQAEAVREIPVCQVCPEGKETEGVTDSLACLARRENPACLVEAFLDLTDQREMMQMMVCLDHQVALGQREQMVFLDSRDRRERG